MPVGEIIAEGLRVHQPAQTRAQRDAAVVSALTSVRMDPETRYRFPHEFSGGQRQRIAIARALILQPDVIVLDEPTSALDVSVQAQIVDLLRELQQERGLSYVFISHDLRVVQALAHDVMVMKDGRVVEAGPAVDIFNNPKESYTKALLEAALNLRAVRAG
jgi:microcin C transport system ATP-binding protein